MKTNLESLENFSVSKSKSCFSSMVTSSSTARQCMGAAESKTGKAIIPLTPQEMASDMCAYSLGL